MFCYAALPNYTGPLPSPGENQQENKKAAIGQHFTNALAANVVEQYPHIPLDSVAKAIGPDWARLGRALGVPPGFKIQFKVSPTIQ
jgi:hypothetical protein